MQAGYLYQHYSSQRPSPEEISDVSKNILQSVLAIAAEAMLRTHASISSTRREPPSGRLAVLRQAWGCAGTTVSSFLRHHFQRVVFHSGEKAHRARLHDFHTTDVTATTLPA
ncbi:MAG: hypothetical protein ACE37N_08975 [Pseudohongiellaceae bacterium]